MFKNVVVAIPQAQATHNTRFIAMLQCNRGNTHCIAVGRTEQEALDKLNAAKAQQLKAML